MGGYNNITDKLSLVERKTQLDDLLEYVPLICVCIVYHQGYNNEYRKTLFGHDLSCLWQ